MTAILAVRMPGGDIPVVSLTAPDPDGILVDLTALLAVADFLEPGQRRREAPDGTGTRATSKERSFLAP